jgi:hypothetical protein
MSPADIDAPRKLRACEAAAVDRAVQDVHSARLSALHAERMGQAGPVETASAR